MFFRKEVGVLFQHVDAQLFNPTVEEEIAFGPLQLGDPPEEVRRKVRETMGPPSLGPLAGPPPFALSGGEKKKVALAAVLATDPQVLFLDEPTAGLDPRSSRILVDLILEAQTRGRTVPTSTNDLHVVSEIAGRVLVLGENRRARPPEGCPRRSCGTGRCCMRPTSSTATGTPTRTTGTSTNTTIPASSMFTHTTRRLAD